MPGTVPSCGPADGLRLAGMTAGYGGSPAVRDVSLVVPAGAFLTLLGPSGCGKTTLLNVVGGYIAPTAGAVWLNGQDVTQLPPERRGCGTVFQNYALFPHLTARGNVAFGLEVRGMPRAEVRRRTDALLDRVGLTPAEWDRRPHQLSGGQQQRVAVARALAVEPAVLLLDEPLANLDRHLRDRLRGELRRLQRETGVTTVLVTHDQEEALAVSDLIGVMRAGRLLQVGPPADVYHRPRTPFVAEAVGAVNVLPGRRMVRPERLVFGGAGCPEAYPGVVAGVTFGGADTTAEVTCDNGLSLRLRAAGLTAGERVTVGVPAGAAWDIPEADDP